MTTIPLPERGLTMLPPWPQAIVFADKRIENRGYGVSRQLGAWRGLVALTQSKTYSEIDAELAAGMIEMDGRVRQGAMGDPTSWKRWAAHLVAVAELMDVLPPERCAGAPWHVPGQWGLILGRVWEVEPVPARGGVGAWTPLWCRICGRIQADSQGHTCRACDEPSMHEEGERPMLRVVRECKA